MADSVLYLDILVLAYYEWWPVAEGSFTGSAQDINHQSVYAEISLGMRPANERRRYNATTSLIDWAHA